MNHISSCFQFLPLFLKFQSDFDEVARENERLREKKKNFESEKVKLQNELTHHKAENDKFRQRNADLRQRFQNLQETNRKLLSKSKLDKQVALDAEASRITFTRHMQDIGRTCSENVDKLLKSTYFYFLIFHSIFFVNFFPFSFLILLSFQLF